MGAQASRQRLLVQVRRHGILRCFTPPRQPCIGPFLLAPIYSMLFLLRDTQATSFALRRRFKARDTHHVILMFLRASLSFSHLTFHIHIVRLARSLNLFSPDASFHQQCSLSPILGVLHRSQSRPSCPCNPYRLQSVRVVGHSNNSRIKSLTALDGL